MRTIARARRRAQGFTLVELMVSLVAGVIIAIAVVGLSKAATTTFYEQVRIQTVEATVRTAAERLRHDLLRVSYMGTGNIRLARNSNPAVPFGQKVSHIPGATTGSRYASTLNLQGIRIQVGGSTATTQGANNLASNNGLKPDQIWITGNMTTDDAYRAVWIGTGTCGGPRMVLRSVADPAVRRLVANAATPAAAVKNAFQPVAGRNFLARVTDARGCHHFVEVCSTSAAPGALGGTQVYIDLQQDSSGRAILTKEQDGTTCGGEEMEEFTISPLQQVRWYLGPNSDLPAAAQPLLESTQDLQIRGQKFNLYRQVLAADGAAAGPPEVVAEYAVDLKFGITVDDPNQAPPNNIRVFDLDTDPGGGAGLIDQWTQTASTTLSNQPGPQRVRSVRFRVAARAPLPDRTAPLSLGVPAPDTYLSRYCIDNAAPSACTRFARVRTIVSEVALINQAGMSY